MSNIIQKYEDIIKSIKSKLENKNIIIPKVIAVSKTFKLEKILPVIVNINVSVIGKRKELDLKKLINFTRSEKISYRKVYFNGKWHRTPIYLRENLFPKFKQNGPAIIEQLDTTIVIHPMDNFFVDDFGNIIIEIYND